MTYILDLVPENTRYLEQQAAESPLATTTPATPYSAVSDLKAPLVGAAAAVNDVAMLAADATIPSIQATIGKSVDDVLGSGTSVQDWIGGIQTKTHDFARSLQPDESASWFGKYVLYGLTETVPQFVLGTAAALGDPLGGAALVGALQANKTMQLAKDQGVDSTTAIGLGGLAGVGGFAGAFLPVKAPGVMSSLFQGEVKSLTANLLTGVSTNLAFGMTNRVATSALLEERGYHDMAQQYKALDGSSMIADAVLGAAFSGYGHVMESRSTGSQNRPVPPRPTPEQVDASLTILNQKHAALDTMPGLPEDPQIALAHRQALETALEQMMRGDPVDVGVAPTREGFIENPQSTKVRNEIAAAIETHLDLPVIEANLEGALPRVPAVLDNAIMGDESFVRVGRQYVPVRWALVDAESRQATLEKADNQFRDRSRAASEAQINEIAGAPDFNLLNAAPLMDFGAPTMTVVNGESKIVGGNGRFEGVSRSYDRGTSGGYRAMLERNLEKFGIRETAAAGMKKPVLVRVIEANIDVQKAALASNEGAGLKMSPLELAKSDAARVGDIGRLKVGPSGEIMSGPNADLIRSWTREMPLTEANDLVDKTGRLSQKGIERLRNAFLYKAYGDSPVLERLIESLDQGSRNVAQALTKSASDAARSKALMASGDLYPQLDLTDDIVQAAGKLEDIRSSGGLVSDYLNQADAFGSEISPEARKILQFFGNHMRQAKAMTDMLRRYWEGVDAAGNPKQAEIFAGGPPSKMEVLDQAIKQTNKSEKPDASELPFGEASAEPNTNAVMTPAQHLERVLVESELARLPADQQSVLRTIYERAAAQKNDFDQTGKDIAAAVGGRWAAPVGMDSPPLKGAKRAIDKILSDYKGDPTKIKDLLRGTIEVDTVDQAQAAVAMLRERFNVLDKGFRDLLDPAIEPIDGYRDAKMNVQLDGVTAEMQVNLPEIMKVKSEVHDLYEERSKIARQVDARGDKDPTPEEQAKIDALNAQMKAAYDSAWASATKTRNLASDMGAPLRRAESYGNGRGGSSSQAAQYGTEPPAEMVTGMPSTSKNSTFGENAGNFKAASNLDIGNPTGVVNNATPRDFFDAANIVADRPDLLIPNERGELVPAQDMLFSADAEIAMAKRDSQGYDAAAACALRG